MKPKKIGSETTLLASAVAQRQHEVQDRAPLYVVLPGLLRIVVHLLAVENEALLHGRDALLLLHTLLHALDGVRRLDVDLELLAGQRLHLDHHAAAEEAGTLQGGDLDPMEGRAGFFASIVRPG